MSIVKQYLDATRGLTLAQKALLIRLSEVERSGISAQTIMRQHNPRTISSLKGRGLIRYDSSTGRLRLTRMGRFWATGG